MKLLLISDKESEYLWDYYRPGRLDGIDMILSCGDLNAKYLTFLVTMGNLPVLYVHGNHDLRYEQDPPEGCLCVEDKLVNVKGLRILGLGGSALYSGGQHQYTERQMARRIRRLSFALHRAGGVDIVLTHAPMKDHGDAPDYAHRGFASFTRLLDRWHPRYLIHGHVHMNYDPTRSRILQYNGTTIINAYERYLLEI